MNHLHTVQSILVLAVFFAAITACAPTSAPPPPPTAVPVAPAATSAQPTNTPPPPRLCVETSASSLIPIGGTGIVRDNESATCHFQDAYGYDFAIEVKKQNEPGDIRFTSAAPQDPKDLSKLPNPTNKKIYRNLIHFTATRKDKDNKDAGVPYFDPAIKVTAIYVRRDLDKAGEYYKFEKDDPKYVFLFMHDSQKWLRLPMLDDSRKSYPKPTPHPTEKDLEALGTVYAYIGSFSIFDDDGTGGDG